MRSVVLACVIFAVVIALAVLGLMPVHTQIYEVPPRAVRVETPGPKPVRVQGLNVPPAKAKAAEASSSSKKGGESRNKVIEVVGEAMVLAGDAERDALVMAQLEIEKYLRDMNPPVYWRPSLEYIRDHLIKKMPAPKIVPVKDEDLQELLKDKDIRRIFNSEGDFQGLKQFELSFEITPTLRRDLLYQARLERSWDRQLLLLPALGVVVLTLLAGAAYINLDERSKGYYTTWLRLTAGGAIAAALGLGLWWFAQ